MHIQQQVSSELEKIFDPAKDKIELIGEAGDNRHFFLKIISEKFENKNRLERSRMIYELLNKYIQDDSLHALRLELKTPAEINN